MSQKIFRRFANGSICGIIIGIVMIILGINFETNDKLRSIYNAIHAPAFWLADLWSYRLKFPPRGEAAFAVVPIIMINIQWMLICIVISFLRGGIVGKANKKTQGVTFLNNQKRGRKGVGPII